MKVVKRIFEHRIRQQIDIDNMQFGFMKGKGTTDAIFIVIRMQKFRAKGRKLCLETARHVSHWLLLQKCKTPYIPTLVFFSRIRDRRILQSMSR